MIVVGTALLGASCVSRAGDFGAAGTDGDGFDDGDDDPLPPDDDGPVPPPPDDDGPMPPPPPETCPSHGEIQGEFVSVFGSTLGAGSVYDGSSCAPSFGPDAHYLWQVPYDGEWQIDTHGSDFDTVLSLHYDQCSGEELACSDDDFDLSSSVRTFLPGDAWVTIVIDGYEDEAGEYILNISPLDIPPPPMCQSVDFGVTTGFTSTFESQVPPKGPPAEFCGREGPQAIFSFTPAESGRYVFEARGELGEPAIVDLRDDQCLTDACMSVIELDLTAGEFVQIGVEVLDPLSPFGLIDVKLVGTPPPPPPPPPPECPQYQVPFGLPTQQNGTAGAGQDTGIGSCAPQAPASIASFEWTAPGYGDVTFSASVAGTLSGIIVQEATCAGAELACAVPTGINGGQAMVTVPVKKGRDYIVTVGTTEPLGTDVTLDVFSP